MLALWSAQKCMLLATLVALLYLQQTRAQDPFDCHVAFDGGIYFDLTPLAGEHVVTRTRETPPSRMIDEVRFDLCKDLGNREGVADGDQCAPGTRACMTMTNQKGGEGDRVIAAIPIAVSSALNPETSLLLSPNKGVNLVFHGSSYPLTNPIPQSLNLSIYCDTTLSEPTFVSYYGAALRLEWRAPSGCDIEGDNPPNGGGKEGKEGDSEKGGGEEHVGSGIGWFFLLLLIAFLAYFVLGAYHNYCNYGATGADLIPHRDFWREVPYVLRDIASHLCSALRPSPRNGYIAV